MEMKSLILEENSKSRFVIPPSFLFASLLSFSVDDRGKSIPSLTFHSHEVASELLESFFLKVKALLELLGNSNSIRACFEAPELQ
jgi:hypothetical protein